VKFEFCFIFWNLQLEKAEMKLSLHSGFLGKGE